MKLFHPALLTFARIFLALMFFTSGMGKLTHGHFPGLMGPVWLETEMAKYGLGFYARFIAFSQVAIGALMLSKRFSLLGMIMMIPMIVNILMVTISLEWRGTPYVVFVFLLINIFLLISEWPRLRFLLVEKDASILKSTFKSRNHKADITSVSSIFLLLMAPVFYDFSPLLCYVICVAGLVLLFIPDQLRKSESKPVA